MNELLTLALAVGIWYALMRFILPALGIPTCMTGACQRREAGAEKPCSEQDSEKGG